jgi:hypothetical protein
VPLTRVMLHVPCAIQGTKKCLSTDSFAVVRSVFFRSIYKCSPCRTSPYRGWGVSSMSPSTLKTCFSCAPASGYCCTSVWCSDFNVERLFLQNCCYPSTWTSPIFDSILTFHLVPSSSERFICREGAEYVVGTRNNKMMFRLTITPNVLVSAVSI